MIRKPFLWSVYCLSLLAPFLVAVAVGRAYHACNLNTCGAKIDLKTDAEQAGGKGQPIKWRSLHRLEHPGNPGTAAVRCYEREVRNESKEALPDVYWQIANFYRRFIPAETPECEPTRIPGEFELVGGPIVVGATRTPVEQTQVYAPKDKWPSKVSICCSTEVLAFSPELAGKTLELGGAMRFHSSPDKSSAGTVTVLSTVQFVAEGDYRYTYKISGKGPDAVLVTWGVLKDAADLRDETKDFLLSWKSPLKIDKERIYTFVLQSKFPPKWGLGAVLIKDSKGVLLARGVASSYGPSTGTIVNPE